MLKNISGYIFGIAKSYKELYKIKNSIITIWITLIEKSNLINHLSSNERDIFILNEINNFDLLHNRSSFILSGSIEYENSLGEELELDYYHDDKNLHLSNLIKK